MFPISFPHNRFEKDKSRKIEMVLVCLKHGGMCNHKKKANGACGSVRYPFSIYWWFSLRTQGFKQPHVSTLTGVELFMNRWWTSRKALLVMHDLRCDACVPWGYSPRIYVAYLHGCYTYNAWDAHPSSWWFIDVHWCSVWSTIEKNVILVSIQTCGDFGVMTLPPGSH